MATTVTLKPNAIDLSGSTSGTTTLQASAVAGTTTVTLPAATDTLVGKATTDTLTNKTLTSPTMTAPVLGTPASGTVTNLTGTASININGTVGATTPAAGSFTTGTFSGQTLIGGASATVARVSLKQSADTHQGYGLGVEAFGNTNILTIGYNGTDGAFVIAPSYISTGGYTDLIMKHSGAEKARITSTGLAVTGALSATGLLDISAATAGQIKFPATQNASSNANTLDDYEEGTWTPTQGAGLTVVGTFTGAGKYTKIGKVVTIVAKLSATTSVAATSGELCGGLPFTTDYATVEFFVGGVTNAAHDVSSSLIAYAASTYGTTVVAATPALYLTSTYFV